MLNGSIKAQTVRGRCQHQVSVQTSDTLKNTHMCSSVTVWEAGPMWKIPLPKEKPPIQWGALQLMWTTVVLLTATDMCWLTPAENLISYALENSSKFFPNCWRASMLLWESTPASRSAGAEFALNLKSSHTKGYWDMCHLIFTEAQRFMYFLL